MFKKNRKEIAQWVKNVKLVMFVKWVYEADFIVFWINWSIFYSLL